VFQETTTWDLRDMHPAPSTGFNLYILFLLVACIVAGTKLLRAWWVVPPFRGSRQANNPAYAESLEAASVSLKHWMGCIFLVWGFYVSVHLYDVCSGFFMTKTIGNSAILFAIRGFASGFAMTFLVALFLFVVRWHLVRRAERLGCGRRSGNPKANK
jgi:hypothetical protein